ncbi:AAA family ATPase [bacterium]|nr:AAA family ATPase [bacterium]
MDLFSEYIHLEEVYDFPESTIFRAQNKKNERPVLIKVSKKEFTKEQYNDIKDRLKKAQKIETHLIVYPLRCLYSNKNIAMTWEDTGAVFLSIILKHKKMDLERFFNIAIQITRSLGELHAAHVVHNDLRPHNIFVDERNGNVVFTGISFLKQTSEQKKIKSAEMLGEDLFLYTSPEQTGRINWDIDQKSDLYSLGIVFYELLTGNTPFFHESPQKRIQNQLVAEPDSILKHNSEYPPILNQIILKLLSKGQEDRYQSAFGLLKDLEYCRQQYELFGNIDSFELAQRDNIERLTVPNKLYGSQENFVNLIESFNRVCTGSVEMMIVDGKAGMGKTTLVMELLGLAEQKGAYIARGRCDREYRDTPYFSLIEAFRSLVNQILNQEKQSIDGWKEKFLKALGNNGQLVIDFIPELEAILGAQPSVPKLDSDEAQNRLNHIFSRFIQTFTIDGNPLVVFIDGFQWADHATIQLIQAALTDIGSRYIMLIVAYQKHLISHSHTFSMSLDEISQSGTSIQRIKVTALDVPDVCLLIEDALSFKQDYRLLATYIIEKTGGNPYFVKLFLVTLHNRKLIQFDPSEGQWCWNIDTIKAAKIPDNIIDLLEEKIRGLEQESIEILKIASCIGNQFGLKTLMLAADIDKETVLKLLEKPIELELIQRADKTKKTPKSNIEKEKEWENKKDINFRFTHSRVQRATYSLLRSKEKRQHHLRLGKLLLEKYGGFENDQLTYQIVNQMNQGIQLIRKQAERHELAKLNLLVGKKSKSAAAFEIAWKFFSIGSELLSKSSWEKDYELTKELYLKRSECEYFIGNTEVAKPIFNLLLQHVRTNREKVEVINLKLNLYIKNNRLEDAIEIGVAALDSLFNEKIPPNDAEITIVSQIKMQDIQVNLEQKQIENLLYLKEMSDPDKKAMMDLIANIIPAAYIVKRNLWVLLTLQMVEISLSHGNTDSSAYAYMNYAVILCSGLQDYAGGYAVGKLALDLNSKFNNHGLISQLNFLFGSYLGHWKNKAVDNITYLNRSYTAGIEYGDFISAGLSVDFLMKTHIMVGSPLEEIQKEVKKHQDFVDQLNNPDLADILEISNLVLLLKDSVPDSSDCIPDMQQSAELLKSVKASKNTQLKQWYYLVNAQIHYFFYNHAEALEMIQESDKLIASYSQLAISEHYFYFSLIIIENYSSFSEENKKKYWDILKNNHQRLTTLANGCPINFRDKELLISALMAGISGNYIKAGDLFDEAIQTASDNGFVQIEAIANELAAKYYLSKDKETIAMAYIRKACLGYIKWGAMRKLSHLEYSYPMLLKRRTRFDEAIEYEGDSSEKSIISDLDSIVKASQELSQEINLDSMACKLIEMLLENIKVQKGFFLVEVDNHIRILTRGVKNDSVIVDSISVPLEECEHIAKSVVFYVIRTKKTIILDDASKDSMFAYNKYIEEVKPKSILCIPIITHDKLNGILYLENTDVARIFSPKLVELLTLFISQVSVSIENAMLKFTVARLTEELDTSKKKLEKRMQLLEQQLENRFKQNV